MNYPKGIIYKVGDVLDHYESIKDTSGKTVAIAATLAAIDALMAEHDEEEDECCAREARACNHTCCRDD